MFHKKYNCAKNLSVRLFLLLVCYEDSIPGALTGYETKEMKAKEKSRDMIMRAVTIGINSFLVFKN